MSRRPLLPRMPAWFAVFLLIVAAILLAITIPPLLRQRTYGHAPVCAGTTEPPGTHCVVEEDAVLLTVDPAPARYGSNLHLRLADGTVKDSVDLQGVAPRGAGAGTRVRCAFYGGDLVAVIFPDGLTYPTIKDPQDPYHLIDAVPVLIVLAAMRLIPVRRSG